MSSLSWHVRGHGIYACGCLFPSLLLDEKGPKNQGRHQGPTALGNRSSPMSAGPARPTQSVFGVPIHSERSSHVIPALACVLARNLWLRHLEICPSYYENPTLHIGVWWGRPFRTLMLYPSFSWNDNALAPCRHGGPSFRERGTPSPTLLGLTPVVASRHREEERRSDPFMTD